MMSLPPTLSEAEPAVLDTPAQAGTNQGQGPQWAKGLSPVSRREAAGPAPYPNAPQLPGRQAWVRERRQGRVVNSHIVGTALGDSISSLVGPTAQPALGWG